jgi:hypothetical protein
MSWLNANEYYLMRAAVEERVEDLQATSDVVLTSHESVEGDSDSCEGADPEKYGAVCGVVTCGVRQGPRTFEGLRAAR